MRLAVADSIALADIPYLRLAGMGKASPLALRSLVCVYCN